MSFLYPTFLWALGVLSIPIIIHLFNFRKTKQIYFSNTRFLKQVKETSTAKRRLKHYLILLSRLLFLAFLVLAFAQPVIPAREQLGSNHNITLYIDNSFSTSAQLLDKTSGFDAALQFSRDIVGLFPPDTRYKVVTNDFAPFSNAYKTKSETLDLLTEVRLSPVSRSMQEIKERIENDANASSKEIFWISDFQKSTAGIIKSAPADSALRWHLVPLQYEALSNVFADSAYLENPFAAAGEKNVLRIKMRNDGNKQVDNLNLKLTINKIQTGTVSITIPAGGVTEASFDLTTNLTGLNKAVVSFNDYPVSFDNEFYITLNFTDKIRIIEIKSTSQSTPVEKVFGNSKVFAYQGFSVDNFNHSVLSQADLVVVNGLNTIDASLSAVLRSYADNLGTLLVIPGDKPDASSYQRLLQRSVSSTETHELAELDKPDFNNPFFENVFEERSTSIAMPKAASVLDWGADRSAILRFKNDQPFLSLFNQKGKLYVLSSPLKVEYTSFFNNALFVPVMYRIAASGKKNDNRLYYNLHENFITIRADSIKGEEQIRLSGTQEIVPSQRKVAEKIFLDIPKFSIAAGFYNVVASSDTVNLIAFNLDKAESLMEQYTGAEVKSLLGNGNNITLFDAASSNTFSNEIKARYLGTPLWKYALILALFFLLVEVLLIRFLK